MTIRRSWSSTRRRGRGGRAGLWHQSIWIRRGRPVGSRLPSIDVCVQCCGSPNSRSWKGGVAMGTVLESASQCCVRCSGGRVLLVPVPRFVCIAGLVVIALTWVRMNPPPDWKRAPLALASARRQFASISRTLDNHKQAIALALLVLSLVNIVVSILAGHSVRAYLMRTPTFYISTDVVFPISFQGGGAVFPIGF